MLLMHRLQKSNRNYFLILDAYTKHLNNYWVFLYERHCFEFDRKFKISSEKNVQYRRDKKLDKILHQIKNKQAKKSTKQLWLIKFNANGIATNH
jgi:hypothetical protein